MCRPTSLPTFLPLPYAPHLGRCLPTHGSPQRATNISHRSKSFSYSYHHSTCISHMQCTSNSNNNNEKNNHSNINQHNRDKNKDVEGDSLEFTLHSRSFNQHQDENITPPIALLPFGVRQVFLPGMTKTLHIYEARWLRMFEEVLATPARQFVHVIVAPERLAMAAHAVLVQVDEWRKLDLGVEVKIAGVGRVKVSRLVGGKPFMRGIYEPFTDNYNCCDRDKEEELCGLEARVWNGIRSVIDLSVELGIDPIVARDTYTARNARPDKTEEPDTDLDSRKDLDVDLESDDRRVMYEDEVNMALKRVRDGTRQKHSVISRLEALSFAAFMVVDASLGAKQKALEYKDTVVRVEHVLKSLEDKRKQLGAKLAVKQAFAVT